MAEEIHDWFVNHEGDDFLAPSRDHPYSVIPTPAGSDCVLYTTKPSSVIAALSRTPAGFPCGLVGRYGLPGEDDIAFLEHLVRDRRFVFVGDADPCDLLIFVWLRSRIDISFHGLSDRLYEQCGMTLEERTTMVQSDAESAAMPLIVRFVPDFNSLLGSDCARLIDSGRKVEVESLVTSAKLDPMMLANAIST